MLKNKLPTLRKEYILDIRETLVGTEVKSHRKHSAADMTPWQIMPVPFDHRHRVVEDDWKRHQEHVIDPEWHQVYKRRHHFIEARAGVVLVTADLQAFYDWKVSTRPGANRYLRQEEVQNIHTDPCDAQGVVLGKVARRGMNLHRLPTRWRVWYKPTGHIQHSKPSRNPDGYNEDDRDMSGWHRVYSTTEGSWFYIETGYEHLRKQEHRDLLLSRWKDGIEGWHRSRAMMGIIKINQVEWSKWLRERKANETIIQE